MTEGKSKGLSREEGTRDTETKNRKRNRVKKRVIRDGFLRAPIYPTISHSALSELFEFVGFKGCSVNPREPGW